MFKKILPINLIISLRFLGLFIVLPVLSVYALNLKNSNEFLVGITIGGYALTQMLLQVPFGMLSDKIGRKRTLVFGLAIFAVGSLVCAYSSDIYTLILGRLLQGAGAIGAVATAMISDMVKEEQRAKAMAIMGGSIAVTFALSMVIGPFIGGHYGVDKLFFITALLAIIGIFIIFKKLPNPPKITHDYQTNKRDIFIILKDVNLLRMNITNMLQKGMMTLAFLIIPIIMVKEFDFYKSELWKVYLPAMLFGVLAMGVSAVLGEKKKKPKLVLIIGIILFALSYALMGIAHTPLIFILGVVLFFVGFNIHEPLLQSLASKYAKIHQKGTALGLFNSFGYLGTFIGALWGGHILKWYGVEYISIVIVVICFLWIILIATLQNPIFSKNLYVELKESNNNNLKNLNSIDGIIEWYVNENEKVLVIKYNSKKIDEERIKSLI